MSAEQQVPPPPGSPASPIQPVGPAAETVRNEDKIMLVLAYLGILSLIPLLTVKDSDFVQWHAKNGLVLAVVAIVVSIITVPMVTCFVTCPLLLAIGILDLMAMVKALNGLRWRIPGVSNLADKL